jgi:two-component system invasion response regulator UvrY
LRAAGADGYPMKDRSTALPVQAIEKVGAGGKLLTPGVAEQLARAVDSTVSESRHAALSPREIEILRLIGTGLAVSEIAEEMSVSVKTVSTYRRRVLGKMSLTNNAQMVHYAIQNKLAS